MHDGERRVTPAEIWLVDSEGACPIEDALATEAPLEIRIATAASEQALAVTMRTPGDDAELAAGFLHCEGLIRTREDVRRVDVGRDRVVVHVPEALAVKAAGLTRHFFTTSACGVCGTSDLGKLAAAPPLAETGLRVSSSVLRGLPEALASAQGVFHRTGGLHAAACFSAGGELVAICEDVGRHNALDKLIGRAWLAGELPWSDKVVLVSGRASYELVQKCAVAGAAVLCAVSAPSSLAVALARRTGMTLVGFLRVGRFNVYAGIERLGGIDARQLRQ